MSRRSWRVGTLSLGLLALLLGPDPVRADGPLILAGKLEVIPAPLVSGKEATVTVPVKTGKEPARQVQLEIRLGAQVVGKLTEAGLGAGQTRAYKVKLAVPADAKGTLTLTIWGQGAQIGQTTVQVAAPPPVARAVRTAPKTVMLATLRATGWRPDAAAARPKTVKLETLRATGWRPEASAPPKTVTLGTLSATGWRE